MNNFTEQLKNVARRIMLSPKRKEEIRANLLHFIKAGEIVRVHDAGRQLSQSKSVLSFFTKPKSILLALALLLGVGGGTSFAAERALPGDILYLVKVDFNEKISGALSFSAEAKAQSEATLANRRLEEASALASKGKLDAQTRSELSARFKTHSQNVETKIRDLEDSGDVNGAANIASEFEALLRAHQSILTRLNAKFNATSSEDSHSLDNNLSSEINSTNKLRVGIEGRIVNKENSSATKTAAEGRLTAAKNIIAAARNYIENRKSRLSAEVAAQVEAELKGANQLVIDGQAKIETGLYGEAFNLANAAIRKAQEARVLIEAQNNLNLEIRFRGDEKEGEIRGGTSVSSSVDLEKDSSGASSLGSDNSGSSSGGLKAEDSERLDINLRDGSSGLDSSGYVNIRLGL